MAQKFHYLQVPAAALTLSPTTLPSPSSHTGYCAVLPAHQAVSCLGLWFLFPTPGTFFIQKHLHGCLLHLIHVFPEMLPSLLKKGKNFHTLAVLISWGSHNKVPQTEWLKMTGIFWLPIFEATGLKWKCCQGPSSSETFRGIVSCFFLASDRSWALPGLELPLSSLCLCHHMVVSLCGLCIPTVIFF